MNNRYKCYQDPYAKGEIVDNILNILEKCRELDFDGAELLFTPLETNLIIENASKDLTDKLKDARVSIKKLDTCIDHSDEYLKYFKELENNLLYIQEVFVENHSHRA